MSALEDFEGKDGSSVLGKAQDSIVRTYMVHPYCGDHHLNSFKIYQRYVDRTTPHVVPRWAAFAVLALLFCLRIVTYQGFYVVAYAWAIYLLNIFLLFLSPKFNPADQDGLDNNADLVSDDGLFDSPQLPTSDTGSRQRGVSDEEFRPFIRRLPEFKFWYNATWATSVALLCTCLEAFDIPVFWPILVMYFFFLFFLTMRRQIHHMIKYKYVPFDIGKKSYSGIGRK